MIEKRGKDKTIPALWRPINILLSSGKIVEKALSRQFRKHLIDNNVIMDNHYGACPGKSIITAFIFLQDNLIELKNKNTPLS